VQWNELVIDLGVQWNERVIDLKALIQRKDKPQRFLSHGMRQKIDPIFEGGPNFVA
jgi:hypothetical protein